jgi:YesN/AraC family two-component response regulator
MAPIKIDGLNKLDIAKKLNILLADCFGLKLDFYQFDKDKIDDYCKSDDICKLIYTTKRKDKCKSQLSEDIKKAIKGKETGIHNCFLGTKRIIIPVKINKKVYGIAISSQLRIKDTKPADKKISAEAEKKIKGLISMDKNKFNALSVFLSSFIGFIFISRFEKIAFLESRRSKSHLQEATNKAIDYIKDNYYRPNLSLSEVSEAVNLSPYYFSHQFKKEHKTTFIDFLTQVRLEASLELLKDLRLNIAQVSFAVGYQDPNYFSKVFKKYMEISPAEYRDKVVTQQVS